MVQSEIHTYITTPKADIISFASATTAWHGVCGSFNVSKRTCFHVTVLSTIACIVRCIFQVKYIYCCPKFALNDPNLHHTPPNYILSRSQQQWYSKDLLDRYLKTRYTSTCQKTPGTSRTSVLRSCPSICSYLGGGAFLRNVRHTLRVSFWEPSFQWKNSCEEASRLRSCSLTSQAASGQSDRVTPVGCFLLQNSRWKCYRERVHLGNIIFEPPLFYKVQARWFLCRRPPPPPCSQIAVAVCTPRPNTGLCANNSPASWFLLMSNDTREDRDPKEAGSIPSNCERGRENKLH